MANPFLHEDILIEIFLRLPAKSVGKFRCLSKTWRTNLSTSRFIGQHLNARKNKQPKLFLKKNIVSFLVVTPPIIDARATFSNKLELPGIPWNTLVNSCNGLVLLLTAYGNAFILVNPITMQHVNVPLGLKDIKDFMCGFGYDNHSDDFKIVICYWSIVDHCTIVKVFSVKSKVWKRVNSPPVDPIFCGNYKGVFADGAIHWVSYVSADKCQIVAFSLADEVFYDIPPPTSARGIFRAHVIEDCLCVLDRPSSLKRYIWIMKEYGVEDSWTKFSVDSHGAWEINRPLCFTEDGKIVFITTDERVIEYNLIGGEAKEMIVDGDTTFYMDGVSFFDSLVSPNPHA